MGYGLFLTLKTISIKVLQEVRQICFLVWAHNKNALYQDGSALFFGIISKMIYSYQINYVNQIICKL
jgi:hypothetical protein